MDGLEAVEVNSQVVLIDDLRLEAKFYSMKSFENKEFWYCGDILEDANYNSIYGLNTQGVGYPIIRMNEFEGLFTGTPEQHSDKFTKDDFESHRLKKDDILICRTNGNPDLIGKSALVAMDYQYVYESHMFKVKPNRNLINSSVLVTFLNTKYGRMEINRLSMQGNQANFSLAKFKEVRIPKFDDKLQLKIEQILYRSHQKLEESKKLYQEAEELLLSELGLLDFAPNNDNISIKSFSDSFFVSGRLDSEYYQPKYDDIMNKIKNYHDGYDVLSNFVDNYSTGYPFSSDSYVDEGTPLIRITNIKNGVLDIENAAKIPVADIDMSPKDIATAGDVLISMSGTIGSSCVVPDNTIAVVNQRIMRISPKNISLNVFPLLINSIVGQSQLERVGTGGVQTNISSGDILSILIPNLDRSIQEQIEAKIKQSFALKEQSKQLLDLAKRAVEVVIEESEQSAFKLIGDYK